MKKNKAITALCVSLIALSSSNSLVYAVTTQNSSTTTSGQTKATNNSVAAVSSSTAAGSVSAASMGQSSVNTGTSSQTVSVSSLDSSSFSLEIGESKISNSDSSYKITSAADFIDWAKGINSGKYDTTRDVYLSNNLDMTGKKVTSIKEFKGTFNGCGHTISNLSYDNSSSASFIDNGKL